MSENLDVDVRLEDVESEEDKRVQEAAATLLNNKPLHKVVVKYGMTEFLLFDSNESTEEVVPIICSDVGAERLDCQQLMKQIRGFLERYYGKLEFISKEIMLEMKCLDLVIYEDNIFNNKITFDDICTIFTVLQQRSNANNEASVPEYLEIELQLRERFATRYNYLVELTESDATFANIRPFTNSENDPLVLDDAPATAEPTQSGPSAPLKSPVNVEDTSSNDDIEIMKET